MPPQSGVTDQTARAGPGARQPRLGGQSGPRVTNNTNRHQTASWSPPRSRQAVIGPRCRAGARVGATGVDRCGWTVRLGCNRACMRPSPARHAESTHASGRVPLTFTFRGGRCACAAPCGRAGRVVLRVPRRSVTDREGLSRETAPHAPGKIARKQEEASSNAKRSDLFCRSSFNSMLRNST